MIIEGRDAIARAVHVAGSVNQLARALGYNRAKQERLRRALKGRKTGVDHEFVADAERYLATKISSMSGRDSGISAPGIPAEISQLRSSAPFVPSGRHDAPESSIWSTAGPVFNPDSGVELPAASYGYGATETGRDNGFAPGFERVVLPESYLRAMTGGQIPCYPDGRPRLLLTHAVGDSMAPYIPDGHPVLVEPETAFVDGARYALWLGDVAADVIKRVEIGAKGAVTLQSDNPNVRPKMLFLKDDAETYSDERGDAYKLTNRGRVLWPFDAGPAVLGQLADFARSLIRA